MAALDFVGGAVADQLSYGSAPVLLNVRKLTLCWWVWIDATAADARLWTKAYFAANSTFRYCTISTTALIYEWERSGDDHSIDAPLTNFAAWGTGKWVFIMIVVDADGADSDQKAYMGDATRPAAPPSSYTLQRAGTGNTVSENTGVWIVGQRGGGALATNGRIGFHAAYRRCLTINEGVRVQKMGAQLAGSIIHSWPGRDGPSFVMDESPWRNKGTISTATVDRTAFVPVVPQSRWMRGYRLGDEDVIAAAGTTIPVFVHHYKMQGAM